jgi:hypothetical protein
LECSLTSVKNLDRKNKEYIDSLNTNMIYNSIIREYNDNYVIKARLRFLNNQQQFCIYDENKIQQHDIEDNFLIILSYEVHHFFL